MILKKILKIKFLFLLQISYNTNYIEYIKKIVEKKQNINLKKTTQLKKLEIFSNLNERILYLEKKIKKNNQNILQKNNSIKIFFEKIIDLMVFNGSFYLLKEEFFKKIIINRTIDCAQYINIFKESCKNMKIFEKQTNQLLINNTKQVEETINSSINKHFNEQYNFFMSLYDIFRKEECNFYINNINYEIYLGVNKKVLKILNFLTDMITKKNFTAIHCKLFTEIYNNFLQNMIKRVSGCCFLNINQIENEEIKENLKKYTREVLEKIKNFLGLNKIGEFLRIEKLKWPLTKYEFYSKDLENLSNNISTIYGINDFFFKWDNGYVQDYFLMENKKEDISDYFDFFENETNVKFCQIIKKDYIFEERYSKNQLNTFFLLYIENSNIKIEKQALQNLETLSLTDQANEFNEEIKKNRRKIINDFFNKLTLEEKKNLKLCDEIKKGFLQLLKDNLVLELRIQNKNIEIEKINQEIQKTNIKIKEANEKKTDEKICEKGNSLTQEKKEQEEKLLIERLNEFKNFEPLNDDSFITLETKFQQLESQLQLESTTIIIQKKIKEIKRLQQQLLDEKKILEESNRPLLFLQENHYKIMKDITTSKQELEDFEEKLKQELEDFEEKSKQRLENFEEKSKQELEDFEEESKQELEDFKENCELSEEEIIWVKDQIESELMKQNFLENEELQKKQMLEKQQEMAEKIIKKKIFSKKNVMLTQQEMEFFNASNFLKVFINNKKQYMKKLISQYHEQISIEIINKKQNMEKLISQYHEQISIEIFNKKKHMDELISQYHEQTLQKNEEDYRCSIYFLKGKSQLKEHFLELLMIKKEVPNLFKSLHSLYDVIKDKKFYKELKETLNKEKQDSFDFYLEFGVEKCHIIRLSIILEQIYKIQEDIENLKKKVDLNEKNLLKEVNLLRISFLDLWKNKKATIKKTILTIKQQQEEEKKKPQIQKISEKTKQKPTKLQQLNKQKEKLEQELEKKRKEKTELDKNNEIVKNQLEEIINNIGIEQRKELKITKTMDELSMDELYFISIDRDIFEIRNLFIITFSTMEPEEIKKIISNPYIEYKKYKDKIHIIENNRRILIREI